MISLFDLDTPSLFVNLDLMESNSKTMMKFINEENLALRPHTKAHKIPDLANFQIAQGANGICTAKLGEAEGVMIEEGIKSVLNTTPIANPQKIERVVKLLKNHPQTDFIQVVDDLKQIEAVNKKLSEENLNLSILVEVECGQQRCGVEVGSNLTTLLKNLPQFNRIKFKGFQAYSGHLQHIKARKKRGWKKSGRAYRQFSSK